MSRRNFILLIIILIIIIVGVFLFLFFRQSTAPGGSEGINFGSIFNPFPSGTTTKPPVVTPPVNISGYQPPAPEEEIKLKKISSMPIAGYGVFMKERLKVVPVTETATPSDSSSSSTTTAPNTTPVTVPAPTTKTPTKSAPPPTEFMPAVRYVARATGNIYQTFADKIDEKKFSGTVIPQIYEAFFGNSGESVIMRYLKGGGDTIETFVGSLPKESPDTETTGNNEIKGSFLPENIKDISMSPEGSSAFYLFNVGDNMIGSTLSLANNKKTQLFSSAFTEWLPFWPNNKEITLTTKPASGIPGYAYALDLNTKNLNKVLGNINGLTSEASPDGKLILYGDDNLSLNSYHVDTKASDPLGVRTLPEKCVWGKASDAVYCLVPESIGVGQYPDTWYQGQVSFSDQVWKVDVKTGNATMLVDPITVKGGEEIDGIKPALDQNENYLFFVNKKDSFLWELKLN